MARRSDVASTPFIQGIASERERCRDCPRTGLQECGSGAFGGLQRRDVVVDVVADVFRSGRLSSTMMQRLPRGRPRSR